MKTLYLDIFSGLSGDMFLGALLDLGVSLEALERELRRLGVGGYHLHASRRQKSQIEGVKFDVHLEQARGDTHRHPHDGDHAHAHHHDHSHSHELGHSHPHEHESDSGHGRGFAEIRRLIESSSLSDWVKEKAVAVFRRVAEAEGKVHGLPADQVHFHEVGAVDSIVDIVGACIALAMLGCPRVLASPVVEGTGWVRCAHGQYPVPTAATLEILGARGIPLTQCAEPHELLTPTGAALLAEFVEAFGPMKGLIARRVGYGLGTRDLASRPNVVRAILGESSAEESCVPRPWETDTVAVLESNLDDMGAEALGYFAETALKEGALDVFHTPVQMKKSRPGVLLTVLCALADADRFAERMMRETGTFGVRRTEALRSKLRRDFTRVETEYGPVTLKRGWLGDELIQVSPEFEDCRKLAEARGVPLKAVYDAARRGVTPS
ncbi:MAG: nickel pincer cofactor biosynthesis protein LarC [Verrucomicrobia bacterium]|nr:nickel pincer cofactor biosynthesis protein LarC [Verrucomicrobiota bacterium]